MKRNLRHIIFGAVVIFLVLLFVVSCSASADDTSKYSSTNKEIEKSLEYGFKNFLPKEDIVPTNAMFSCSINQPLWGEENFFIFLKCCYPPTIFSEEQERIKPLFEKVYTFEYGRTMYTTRSFQSDVSSLLDDNVLDGKTYYFEVVVFDESTLNVEYFLALERDQNQTEFVIQTLVELMSMIETQLQ